MTEIFGYWKFGYWLLFDDWCLPACACLPQAG
jgi:hypothetical protein